MDVLPEPNGDLWNSARAGVDDDDAADDPKRDVSCLEREHGSGRSCRPALISSNDDIVVRLEWRRVLRGMCEVQEWEMR